MLKVNNVWNEFVIALYTICYKCHLAIFVILLNVPFGTNSKTNPSVGCGMRMKYHLSPELSVSVYFITSTTAPFFSFGNSLDGLFLLDFV